MRLSKLVPEYEIIPPRYGIAYRAVNQCDAICYPIPLNRLVRIVRELWLRLRVPEPSGYELLSGRAFIDSLTRAHEQGFRRGFDEGWDWLGVTIEQKLNEDAKKRRAEARE